MIGMSLQSLDRLAEAGDVDVLPGHGKPLRGLPRRRHLASRYRERAAEIEALRADRHASVWQMAERVGWTGGWAATRGFLRSCALLETDLQLSRADGLAGPTGRGRTRAVDRREAYG